MSTLIMVHGVGLWPGCFAPVEAHAATGGFDRIQTWVRPGYRYEGEGPSLAKASPVASVSSSVSSQVALLRSEVEGDEPTVVLGVSGGATLALALAIDPPDNLVRAVAHEPLIGPLEPDLHQRVQTAGERLAATSAPTTDALSFLRVLYGAASWDRLPSEAHAWASAHSEVVCQEVNHFAAFSPTLEAIRQSAPLLTTTVGQRSGPERQRVAELLAEAGADTVSLAECGHLAPIDNPQALAEAASL